MKRIIAGRWFAGILAIILGCVFCISCAVSPRYSSQSYSSYETTPQNTIQAESLKFFESGYKTPEMNQRTYNTSFSQNTTRYVYYQIRVKNFLWNKRTNSVSITAKYYKPDGTLTGSPVLNYDIPSDQEYYNLWHGWGWNEAGNWEPGNYRVELWAGGDRIAQGDFSIVGDSVSAFTPAPAKTITFQSLKFFESGYDAVPPDQRKYNTAFSQQNTRYVSYELVVKNHLAKIKANNVRILAKYYKPDGTLMSSPELKHTIPSDYEDYSLWHGWGWNEAGNWELGTYRVEIWVADEKFAEGQFTITGGLPTLPKKTLKTKNKTVEYEFTKFFEGPHTAPAQGSRTYQQTFNTKSTRYVFAEVGVKNLLYNVENHVPDVVVKYYDPDGSLKCSLDIASEIKSDWESVDLWTGWGWDDAGNWSVGTYNVEIWIDGKKVDRKEFKIVGNK